MSNKITAGKYDVLVVGDETTKTMLVKFMDIDNIAMMDEFHTFVLEELGQLWPKPSNMGDYLDERFKKPTGYFACEYPNIFKGAADRVSNELYGVDYSEHRTPEQLRHQIMRVLFWVAFLSKHRDIQEEPEIFSGFAP